METSPPRNVPGLLEVKTTGITRVESLDSAHLVTPPSEALSSISQTVTAAAGGNGPFASQQQRAKSDTATKVSSLERIAAQLQANQLMRNQTLEIKTEAMATSSGPILTTSSVTRTSNSPVQYTSSSSGGTVSTETLSKVNLDHPATGTGTGSVTATPTSYMTAVTTTASTTSASTQPGGQDSSLGKRVRKQSSKYEDYEQPSLTVRYTHAWHMYM